MQQALLVLVDLLGTFAFAVSGAAAARERRLDVFGVYAVAFVTACGGAFIPGAVGDVSAIAYVVVLIGAPALRVIWLTVGWARQGDRRFAALGGVLVAVVVASAAIAFVR